MYVDKQAEFSDSQVVTASAVSTNIYDTFPVGNGVNSNPSRDIGGGEDVRLVIQVDTTATAAGAATVTVTLESADNAALTGSTVHFTSQAYPLASLGGGKTLAVVTLPADSYKRYIGLRYNVGTGPLTAGAFSAFITKDVPSFRAYQKGYNF